ncbi:hypothetical protein J6590_055866 [Homalodisca vitripennis]|nr:hypothetical protein J6590_055866 [Homalodisca vitripennis]
MALCSKLSILIFVFLSDKSHPAPPNTHPVPAELVVEMHCRRRKYCCTPTGMVYKASCSTTRHPVFTKLALK